MNPRANRNAATISQTVTLPYPDNASWIVKRRRIVPAAITTIITEPAGSGRVISAHTVAANRQRRPQLRASNPACGRIQIVPARTSGRIHRHRSAGCATPAGAVTVAGGTMAR